MLSVQVDRAQSAMHATGGVASVAATRARAIPARRPAFMWPAKALCVLLGILTVLALLHRAPVLWLFASHGDFSDFYHAAQAAMAGRDPYAVPLYHYFPAFTLLLRPLSLFSQETAYIVWLLFLALIQGAALTVLVRRWGRRVVPAMLALTPALLIGFMVSQPVPLLVLALAGAVSCLERGRATLAGALLAVAWLKPQVALPAVCLFVALRPRVALGFVPTSLALLALPSLPAWLHVMRGFVVEREIVQASLAGLWPAVLGPSHHGYLVLVLLALGASGVVQYRVASPARALSWLLLVWFIVAPYSHAYDTALLVVPLAVLGPLPSVFLLDCWLCTALSFYSLPTAVAAAPLIIMGAWPHDLRLKPGRVRRDHTAPGVYGGLPPNCRIRRQRLNWHAPYPTAVGVVCPPRKRGPRAVAGRVLIKQSRRLLVRWGRRWLCSPSEHRPMA